MVYLHLVHYLHVSWAKSLVLFSYCWASRELLGFCRQTGWQPLQAQVGFRNNLLPLLRDPAGTLWWVTHRWMPDSGMDMATGSCLSRRHWFLQYCFAMAVGLQVCVRLGVLGLWVWLWVHYVGVCVHISVCACLWVCECICVFMSLCLSVCLCLWFCVLVLVW